ncbi:MAG: YidC/Oxa1 family membrane protein insertase [Bacillota bacterium]
MGQFIDAIAELFSIVLSYIYGVIPNFGVAIILLTLLVKLITFPLNNKQIQSAKRMQELQPEIKKIQQKYKNDKEKQNKAVMEFMQENKMNPLAGCMPLIIQFPILIGIFRLLSQAERFIVPRIDGFNPYLIQSIEFLDLLSIQKFDTANLLNFSVSIYYLFPIIAGVTTYIYQKQTMADANQKMLLYMMPVMITFFSFSFPAGLVLYWILNNVYSMGQHYLVGYLGNLKKGQAEDTGKKGEKEEK